MSPFAALHDPSRPLVIPNAWDVASAKLFESLGFSAVATTSAGVAWALGYADGEALDPDELVASVARIARRVACPLSVDLEAGFSTETAQIVDLAERVVSAGACGLNLEDWDVRTEAPFAIEAMRERIAALKARFGDALFVNARTDILLRDFGPEEGRVDEVTRRLSAFADAGADGAFVPGVSDEPTIATIAAATTLPLNVLANADLPSVARLGTLGVARISVGSGVHLRALGAARAAAREVLERGTFAYLRSPEMVSYGEMNALLS